MNSLVILIVSLLTLGIVQCYDNCIVLNANPSIQMEWTISGNSLTGHVTAATSGWAGIGFHATPCTAVCMPATDYVVATNGSISSMTKVAGGVDGAPVTSTAQVITNPSVLTSSNSSNSSSLQFTFTRALNTGSVNISTTANQSILFAFGNGAFGYHGVSNRNVLPINWGNNGYLCARTTTGSGVATTGVVHATTGHAVSGSGNSTGNSGGGNQGTSGKVSTSQGTAILSSSVTSSSATQGAASAATHLNSLHSLLLVALFLSLLTLF